jgi:cytochrome P450
MSRPSEQAQAQEEGSVGGAIPSLSLSDNLIYNLGYAVPMGLQGSFTRNRFWVGFWSRVHPDPAAVRFVGRLRRKYRADFLYLRLLATKSLLVLDRDGVRRVLDHSPTIYADGRPKREGMRVFQPNAVTISRGEDWRDRRRFNEAVLDSGRPVHRYASEILRIVRDELVPADGPPPPLESWDDFDRLFARITRQVIFGRSARDDAAVTDLLRRMMREANRPIRPRKSRYFDPFYRRVRAYLRAAEAGSLVALCREAPSTERTRVENQIPHWMFAMWETLSANTVRALAVILAHPHAEERVRQELAGSDLATADGIDRLEYLEGCLQEAMRLWPTTPMLVRETVAEDSLGGARIPAGTQVLIWNSFNHRDRQRYPLADTFSPEQWANGRPDPLFNHLSSGPQVCAGIDLLLFIAKAVVARILDGRRYRLVKPALDPSRPMPYAYNYFAVEFAST